MNDLGLRQWIYRRFADTGSAPTSAEVAELLGSADRPAAALQRLHDAHFIVLDDDGEILMALPFATRPTGHRVSNERGSWEANCAWDALAIPAAFGEDATIEATWMDSGEPVELAVQDSQVVGEGVDGFIHFAISARQWWDDIVET